LTWAEHAVPPLMTSTRTDATHRPTYSMARAIRLPHGKKVLSVDATVCIVACLTHKFGLCVLKLLVTLTDQWLHTVVRASACQSDGRSASSVHTTLVYMSCRANGVLNQCAVMYTPSVTCLLDCFS